MVKSIRIGYTLASVICTILLITLLFANIYPCGYWEKTNFNVKEGYAGHGYHSFTEVVGKGFFWEAEEVPVLKADYKGNTTSGYYAMGLWWISLLYIPIFIGIIYLGWLIAGGRERFEVFNLPSKKSGKHKEELARP